MGRILLTVASLIGLVLLGFIRISVQQVTLIKTVRIDLLECDVTGTPYQYNGGSPLGVYWEGPSGEFPFAFNLEGTGAIPMDFYISFVNGPQPSFTYGFALNDQSIGSVSGNGQSVPTYYCYHPSLPSGLSEGMNVLKILSGGGFLQELTVFIEYQYEETTPTIGEVSSTELLMILGLTVAIFYSVYSKARLRLRKHDSISQKTLPS